MLSEYAASWPREAEVALNSAKSRYRRLMPGSRGFRRGEITLVQQGSSDDGLIFYDIELSAEFEAEVASRMAELEGQLSSLGKKCLEIIREHNRGWDIVWTDDHWGTSEIVIPRDHYAGFHDQIKAGSILHEDVKILKLILGD